VITVQEISAGLYGAWRLAQGDKSGRAYFNASAQGAKRSFYAALIALPITTVLLFLDFSHREIDAPAARVALVFLLAFALDWAAFPLVVLRLTPMMGCDTHILRYISALNWARILEPVILMPAAMASVLGAQGLGTLLSLILVITVLVYYWFVAKIALEVTGPQAAFLVGLNFVMGIIISILAVSIIQ